MGVTMEDLLPHKFTLSQNFVSLHHRISVEADGHNVGSYHREIISFHDKYHLRDKKGHTVATALKSVVSWGAEYKIKRKGNKEAPTYMINEKKLSSKVSIGDIFEITKDGHEVATCRKTDLVHESVSVKSKSGHHIATLEKKLLGVHDKWGVSVKDDSPVESYVLGFFAAIIQIEEKIAHDEQEKKEHDKKKHQDDHSSAKQIVDQPPTV